MRVAIAVSLLPFLGACSVAWHKVPATLATTGQTQPVTVWIRADPREQPISAITDTILFPLDALFSLLSSVAAFGDDRVDIQAGPGGTLVAMLLPFITATYDPDVDSLEEMQVGNELPHRRPGSVLIAIPAPVWGAWQRGERSLEDAVGQSPTHQWLAQKLRSGDAEIELADGGR